MPISPAEDQDLQFAKMHPFVAKGLAPVLATAVNSAGAIALARSGHPGAIGMLAPMAASYGGARVLEGTERTKHGIPQAVSYSPAAAIGGMMLPIAAGGVHAALTPGGAGAKMETFLKYAPHAITGAALGRAVALHKAYKDLEQEKARSGQTEWWPEKAASESLTKAAMFDFISELPLPGGKFPSSQEEMNYTLDHPVLTTFKPMQIGGAAVGAMAMPEQRVAGAALGYAAGSIPEAALRYQHLMRLKRELEHAKAGN